MFGHWVPSHVHFPMLIFERSYVVVMLHIMMCLSGSVCVSLVTLCNKLLALTYNILLYTNSNANVANICNACNSNDGFREQRPRWGTLPIRQLARACPRWNS